jgi:hypothetical protein
VDVHLLFERSWFLAGLLKREEVVRDRITKENRAFFDHVINLMVERRIILLKDD